MSERDGTIGTCFAVAELFLRQTHVPFYVVKASAGHIYTTAPKIIFENKDEFESNLKVTFWVR